MKALHPSWRVGAVTVALLAGSAGVHAQVALVAGAKSGAGTLTADQAAALFLGKSDKVNGVTTLQLVDQSESSPVREQFYNKVTGKTPAQVKAAWTRLVFSGKAQPPKEVAGDADVKKLLESNPNAIGYIAKGAVDANVKVLLSVE